MMDKRVFRNLSSVHWWFNWFWP